MHNIRSQKESKNKANVCNDKLEKIDNQNSLNVGIDVNVEYSVKNANKKDDCVNNENSNGKMYKKDTNCCNDGTNKIETNKSVEVNESSMKDPIKSAEKENNRMTDNKDEVVIFDDDLIELGSRSGIGFARVLVEMDDEKEIKEMIKIVYKDENELVPLMKESEVVDRKELIVVTDDMDSKNDMKSEDIIEDLNEIENSVLRNVVKGIIGTSLM
uniref:Uncharacterized protein n=1 Tax=Tanacetum cinerariifolium TaxID=118510 RepID=A0A6L2LW43_TANCI|nr:hypothetical protein [Tanacetum cinerariifolium]